MKGKAISASRAMIEK